MRKICWIYFVLLVLVSGCTSIKSVGKFESSFIQIQDGAGQSKTNEIIDPYKTRIDEEMNKVIGTSSIAMPKEKGLPETLLGNFVADVVLDYAQSVDEKVDLAVLNNGGLRTSLPAGEITIRNIYELMPFDNEIVILELDGEMVLELFQLIAANGGVPIAGAKMTVENINGRSVLTNVWVNGELVSKENEYKVATSDYLANGGDNMNFWEKSDRTSTSMKIRDAIINYIRLQTDKQKKISSSLDGRVKLN